MALRDLFPSHARAAASAASFRAPMRGEIYPIAVATTAERFAVPVEWRGSIVRVQADGGDLYLQTSTGNDANADKDARAGKAVNAGTTTLTVPGANTGCFKIPDGTWLDVPMPDAAAATFALQGSAACVARCHLSET
jgi:hypothetical protein